METAKTNRLRPFRYFQFLLERLSVGTPIEDCLLWGQTAQTLCR
ncbi:transposase domain-containing protein [Acutalibacter sp. 1XD8-33]